MASKKTTDTTTITIHQVSHKAETTRTNNLVDIVTQQTTNPEIVKLVLTAEGWDITLKSVEHHKQVRTKGNKIRTPTKTIRICGKQPRPQH